MWLRLIKLPRHLKINQLFLHLLRRLTHMLEILKKKKVQFQNLSIHIINNLWDQMVNISSQWPQIYFHQTSHVILWQSICRKTYCCQFILPGENQTHRARLSYCSRKASTKTISYSSYSCISSRLAAKTLDPMPCHTYFQAWTFMCSLVLALREVNSHTDMYTLPLIWH